MEVHLLAKLDLEGRLESVQSSCTQSSPQSSPVLPFAGQNGGHFQQSANTFPRSEKLVPYVEKKDLVYRLDAKVDEMGLIITQMAELNKRVKVQEKLIAEYEGKLKENKKTIAALRKENEELKKKTQGSVRTSLSVPANSNATMSKQPHIARPLSWPLENPTLNKYNKNQEVETDKDMFARNNFDETNNETLESDNNLDDVLGIVHNGSRPLTLTVAYGNNNPSVAGPESDEQFSLRCREASDYRGYSYVKKQHQLCTRHRQGFVETMEFKKTSVKETNSKSCAIGTLDKDGYLVMNRAHDGIFDNTDSFNSFCLEMDEHDNFRNRSTNGDCKVCAENEAIHSTWTDVKNGNFITRQDDTHDGLEDEMFDPLHSNHGYASIPSEHVPEHVDRPPIPNPRPSRLQRSNTSESIDVRRTMSQTLPNDPNKGPTGRDRSSSFPNGFLPLNQPTDLRKDGKQRQLLKSKSSCSFDKSHYQGSKPECVTSKSDRRSLGNEMKKDDDLNKVLKDMRTTMEWNKAKKKLISRSHHNTVDNVEMKLRSTVQAVYGSYTTLYGEQGSRSKKFSTEKVLKKMKEKIGKPDLDDQQCDEFFRKCLDLVHRTVHLAKTP